MRRSKRIATLAAGGACLLVLTACEEKPDVFGSVEQCAMNTGDRTLCEQEFGQAQAAHEETAPKFEQQASCEEVYGQGKCVPAQSASGGGSFFMPAMMGFMLGRMMGGAAMPVYYDRRGYAYTRGAPASTRIGGLSRAPAGAPDIGGTRRGGFGATGSLYSSGS